MKKLAAILFASVCLMIALISVSNGAEYVVKPGDNLSRIAKTTGHTVKELILMNLINNPELIYANQEITYVSADDKIRAKVWAEGRMSVLDSTDKNYEYFGWVLEDIKNNHLRYHINEPSGTYFESILVFAKAQGEVCRAIWMNSLTGHGSHGKWTTREKAKTAAKENGKQPELFASTIECR